MGRHDGPSLGRRQCVLEKFGVLEAIYLSRHGGPDPTGGSGAGMPPHLRELLPAEDGWCFSPTWEAPRPVELWSGQFLAGPCPSTATLPAWAATRLAEIEESVVQRATAYRLVLHADRLVGRAVGCAEAHVQSVLPDEGPPARRAKSCDLAAFAAALEEERARAVRGHPPMAAAELSLGRLRLDWLCSWRDEVRRSVRGLRRREGIYSTVYEVQRSVRAADIAAAHAAFIRTSETHGLHPTDLLGDWYLRVLGRCGATGGDLGRIWAANARGVQRRSPKVLTTDRAWGRIALKRLANHVNYRDRREDGALK